jgi:hypothetical protein
MDENEEDHAEANDDDDEFKRKRTSRRGVVTKAYKVLK